MPSAERKTLIHIISSGEWGGKERYAFDICRHFKAARWEVKVLTRDAKAVDYHFAKGEIPIEHAPLRRYPDYFSARTLAALFKNIPKGEGIVHVHCYEDALTCIMARKVARRADVRLVMTNHTAQKRKGGLLRKWIYAGIDSHLFVSEFSKEKFYGPHPDIKPAEREKVAVAFNSLLDSSVEPVAEPEKGPVVAAYRGGLKPGKGLETLIDAMVLLRKSKLRLHLMGNGHPDYVDALRRRASLAGVADRIDWIKNSEFAEEKMLNVHFGVLPSEEPEAFGMANLEFMACGKAQISTFSGAVGEVLKAGEDSLRVPPGDARLLAEAMESLAADSELRKKMGSNALKNFKRRFAWKIFLKRLNAAYGGKQEIKKL